MALRSGYKGIKKLASGLKWNRPGILAADDTALAKVFFPRSEQAVLGAKNLFDGSKANWSGGTGANPVKNADYTIDLSAGTLSADFTYPSDVTQPKVYKFEPNTSYTISYGKTAISNVELQVYIKETSSSSWARLTDDSYTNTLTFTTPASFYDIWARILIRSGRTIVASKLYPMITLASDTDLTYAPYAMTNKELTKKVAANVVDIKTDFKTALMSATGSTVTDVESAMLSTYGDLMILNSRINKAANTGINCNVSVPYSVLPKTRGTVYVGLNSPMGAGTASLGGGSLALRYTNSDGATYVDLTVVALMDKS